MPLHHTPQPHGTQSLHVHMPRGKTDAAPLHRIPQQGTVTQRRRAVKCTASHVRYCVLRLTSDVVSDALQHLLGGAQVLNLRMAGRDGCMVG